MLSASCACFAFFFKRLPFSSLWLYSVLNFCKGPVCLGWLGGWRDCVKERNQCMS
jgi:hypothetical protein